MSIIKYLPDASTSRKGIVQLTGDLGGTAASPTIKTTNRIVVAPYGDTRPADYHVQSATAAEVEINAAIEAANALTGGGVVDLLDGTFMTSGSIVPLNDVYIRGQGMFRTKIISASGAAFSLFDNQSVYSINNPWTNAEISDLELDGSNFNVDVGSKGLDGHGMVNVKIHHVYVHDTTASGLGFDYPYATTVTENLVVSCGFIGKRTITAASWSSSTITITTATAHGYTGSAKATGTLTVTGTISDGDTVTLGIVTYTFKDILSGAAYEVAIAGSNANAISNLKKAVNLTGVAGTDYGTGTLIHQLITGDTLTSTTLVLTAKNYGTGGNALATTTTSAGISFGGAVLSGGTTGDRIVIAGMTPQGYNGIYNVSTVLSSTQFNISASLNNSGTLNLAFDPGTATAFGTTSDFNIGHNGIGIASGGLPEESVVVSNNVCIGNQNNNLLIETDFAFTGENAGYIFANNISLFGGTCGLRNTGARNAQFLNNYDYGSLVGAHIAGFPTSKTITAASWSAGIATFTTSSAHGYAIGTKLAVSGMLTTAYNGYYTVASVPTTTTFTVAIASDPGSAVFDPNSPTVKATTVKEPTEGSMFNNNVFSHNAQYGMQVDQYCDNYSFTNNHIKNSGHYGMYIQSGNGTINNNKIFGSGRTAIDIVSGGTYWPLDDIDIIGNHCYNSGTLTTGDGIVIDSTTMTPISNVNIGWNHCFDNQPTPTQRYGILIASGGVNSTIQVTNNIAYGNTTKNIYIQDTTGTVFCSNNPGTNPVGKVTLGTSGSISGAITFDRSAGDYFPVIMTGNVTATMPAPDINGSMMVWVVRQGGTGSYTITLPGNTDVGRPLTLSTAVNATDILTWVYDSSTTKWRLAARSIAVPQTVDNGGTGKSALSAYAVLTGGTTSTGAMQQVSGVGTSGQVLTSNGASALPTWQAAASAPDASTSTKGIVQLTNDLGGTATAPTVLATHLSSALPVNQGGTGAATLTGILVGNGTSAVTTVTAPSGTIVGTSDTQTFTNKRTTKRIGTTASSATPSISTDSFDQYNITALAANITSFTLTGSPNDGDTLIIRIKDNGTARTIAAPTNVTNSGNASFPATTVISKTHTIGLRWDAAATSWIVLAADPVGY